jgi:limonene-1,2-epoxide hydrolase
MSTPTDVVKTFLAMWETRGGIERAIRTYFTDETLYENVGLSTTTGIDQALAVFAGFTASLGMETMWVENLHVSASGDTVLTERIDHVRDGAGKTLMSIRVMGVFELEDGKIVAWRDYFDTAGLAAGAG